MINLKRKVIKFYFLIWERSNILNGFKGVLKKSEFIKKIYISTHKIFFSSLVRFSPVLATKYIYKVATGKKINLNNPRDFNEKLQWL